MIERMAVAFWRQVDWCVPMQVIKSCVRPDRKESLKRTNGVSRKAYRKMVQGGESCQPFSNTTKRRITW